MNLLDNGYNLILVYMLAGLTGTLWETLLHFVRDKKYVNSTGSIISPFNFVYGFGGVCVILTFYKLVDYPYLVFLLGGLLGGIVEYTLSYFEQLICHTQSWNYKGRILNINGRTTVPIIFLWGLLCVIILYIVYVPFCGYVINRYIIDTIEHAKIYHIVMIVSLVYCIIDLILVISVMLRHKYRVENKKAKTLYGKIIDKLFDDEYFKKHFPNSETVK